MDGEPGWPQFAAFFWIAILLVSGAVRCYGPIDDKYAPIISAAGAFILAAIWMW